MIIQLALSKQVAPQFLEFIGVMDGISKRLFLFNIMDPQHPNYKSTIAYEVKYNDTVQSKLV